LSPGFGRFRLSLAAYDLPNLLHPAPDRLVAELHSQECHHQVDIPKAHTEVEIEPYALRDDLSWKPITTIRVGWHSISISSLGVTVPIARNLTDAEGGACGASATFCMTATQSSVHDSDLSFRTEEWNH
jgi:hypothetical protein